ncbi:hypothetical protein BD626DRAFT_625209 [Schizophyllum amplum]|uniref:Magnesium transporter NIPA-domain-containing protein n=1 Tax=Schizophyllum amplum TaxID=97359 RepID=A0A550CYU8_9AGAR|nr:hypothetical protein BD626DRAFT_625209 [Auriculariopsis ampla]
MSDTGLDDALPPPPPPPGGGPPRHGSPVVAFIIGLAIILLASILNAAGLNLTKLDHVRTSHIPKAQRRKDWMRPLWLLGMLLYILSQLIGSTLALEYMRAEYVAPLGSTSLIFNFLFARFLVGTPVTTTDIYGTITIILGVIGIVAFGSINSGLVEGSDVDNLTHLWRRGGWLGYFFAMAGSLILLLIGTDRLDGVLVSRNEISSSPRPPPAAPSGNAVIRAFRTITGFWAQMMTMLTYYIEAWTATKDDKLIAWTLGIGWACAGGGLAGLCLVFAKATVKLLSGSLSHENEGNQFGHAAPIFTLLLLACTAVMQIICLNRGLKVYESTLVVPVFYGVYTASGFLDSLIFNDEVDAYQPWTLFLIFVGILILISGVVLLTYKKPEVPDAAKAAAEARPRPKQPRHKKVDDEEAQSLADDDAEHSEQHVLWTVGEPSDDDAGDDDVDHHQNPLRHAEDEYRGKGFNSGGASGSGDVESVGLLTSGTSPYGVGAAARSRSASLIDEPLEEGEDQFGEWKGAQDEDGQRTPLARK